jgi:hypothetical protein
MSESKEMLEEPTKAGIKSVGQVFTMRHNGPFTPWFICRIEVAVLVELSLIKSSVSTKHV